MLLKRSYTELLRRHYEKYFSIRGRKTTWNKGPSEKLNSEFYVLEIPPNRIKPYWVYTTIGMSFEMDGYQIELFIYSPKQDDSLTELLTCCASYHRNVLRLDLNHSVNFGRSWLDSSVCDHGLISLPYLEGPDFEIFAYRDKVVHNYWLIPITCEERDFKVEKGTEALEQLFEDKGLEYNNPNRQSLI